MFCGFGISKSFISLQNMRLWSATWRLCRTVGRSSRRARLFSRWIEGFFVPECHICCLEVAEEDGYYCSDCGEFTCNSCCDGDLCELCLCRPRGREVLKDKLSCFIVDFNRFSFGYKVSYEKFYINLCYTCFLCHVRDMLILGYNCRYLRNILEGPRNNVGFIFQIAIMNKMGKSVIIANIAKIHPKLPRQNWSQEQNYVSYVQKQ